MGSKAKRYMKMEVGVLSHNISSLGLTSELGKTVILWGESIICQPLSLATDSECIIGTTQP